MLWIRQVQTVHAPRRVGMPPGEAQEREWWRAWPLQTEWHGMECQHHSSPEEWPRADCQAETQFLHLKWRQEVLLEVVVRWKENWDHWTHLCIFIAEHEGGTPSNYPQDFIFILHFKWKAKLKKKLPVPNYFHLHMPSWINTCSVFYPDCSLLSTLFSN